MTFGEELGDILNDGARAAAEARRSYEAAMDSWAKTAREVFDKAEKTLARRSELNVHVHEESGAVQFTAVLKPEDDKYVGDLDYRLTLTANPKARTIDMVTKPEILDSKGYDPRELDLEGVEKLVKRFITAVVDQQVQYYIPKDA